MGVESWSNARLSLALRGDGLVSDVMLEAASRLAGTASHEGAKTVTVRTDRARLPVPVPIDVNEFSGRPPQLTTIEVRNLRRGEFRAVSVEGNIVIVHREP